MSMARRQRRHLDIWPGFVDALGALLAVILFLLMVFVVAQFYLTQALSGREQALQRLERQIVELTDLLALERESNADLKLNIAQLSADLQGSVSARDDLTVFLRYLGPAARVYEANTNLIGGLAIIENAYDQTAHIQWLDASEIGAATEESLLDRARSMMPSLPFPEIDVLVLRHIGKNISGTGMDTNIINRVMIPRQPEPTNGVDVAIITVLDLTRETHGNAAGIGLANVTTARVAQQIDWHATYTNSVTSGIFGMFRVSLPITMPDDHRALQVAVRGCAQPAEAARIVFIQDTLHVDRMWVSPTLRQQVEAHPQLSVTGEVPLTFDNQGTMTAPWQLD